MYCLSLPHALHDIFETTMSWYSLFMLKVPLFLITNQTASNCSSIGLNIDTLVWTCLQARTVHGTISVNRFIWLEVNLLVKFIKYNQNYYLERWSTESQSVLPDRSRRPYTFERKDNRPWTVMRAATNWATHTTAFLTWHLPVVSRIGRTEYQLLLTKAYDRGRNVKF